MHHVDMDALPYEGSFSQMRAIPQSPKRARGKHKGNKVAPRGLYGGGYARRSRKAAVAARVVEPSAPQAHTYSDLMARFGSVGKDYNEN